MTVDIRHDFDPASHTFSYLISDPGSRQAAVIDPVLGFDAASGRTDTSAADRLLQTLASERLQLAWILETHAHADHLSSAAYLKQHTGARIGIGKGIRQVQAVFGKLFNLKDLTPDGSQFDHLFDDGERICLGDLTISVMHTPGHTPACVAYRLEDAVFVGDTLFMPDYGSARCDFPGGDAATLYRSVQRLYELPDDTRIYLCHDYLSGDRLEYAWQTTVAAEKQDNIHLHEGVTETEFVSMRQARDATLAMPSLLLPAIQVNIRAGELPAAADNGIRYLSLPLDAI